MSGLKIKEIPTDVSQKHPPPPHPFLPKHPFSIGIIAPKGSGKTTLICNLLYFYKNYFHGIVIFSPTINNDEKWVWLKKQKLLATNKPLEKFLTKGKKGKCKSKKLAPHIDSFKRKADSDDETSEDVCEKFLFHKAEDFNGTIPDHLFFDNYDKSDLDSILEDQQELTDYLADHNGDQHLKNRLLIVFDDLVGSTLFGKERGNMFVKFNANMRHYSASCLIVTQAFMEIPKTVRTQFTCLILFEIQSEGERKVIEKEYPMNMMKEKWKNVYEYCVKDEYSFLYFNTSRPKGERIMKNFDKIVNIDF